MNEEFLTCTRFFYPIKHKRIKRNHDGREDSHPFYNKKLSIMKTTFISTVVALLAVSGSEAFAHSGRSFVTSTTQQKQQIGLAKNPFLMRGGAQEAQKKAARHPVFRYTEVSASAAATEASASDDGSSSNLLQSVTSKPLTKAVLSSTLFIFTDMVIKNIFKTKGISFPSSLAGCCFLASTLLAAPFHEKLYRVLNPGAKLMQKFMMVFLVPNLIILPLCGGSYTAMEVSINTRKMFF